MKNRSKYGLLDVSKILSKDMRAFLYLFRGSIPSPISLTLNFELKYCPGGDLVIF